MSKVFGIGFGLAVVAIIAFVWLGFVRTEGNHLAPTGNIGKVRTVKVADDLTLMILDFKIVNDSDVPMVVRSVEASIDLATGNAAPLSLVAASDVLTAFESYSELGEKFNPVLKERDTVPPHQTVDRMVGLRIEAPLSEVEARRKITLRVEDVTGPVAVLAR